MRSLVVDDSRLHVSYIPAADDMLQQLVLTDEFAVITDMVLYDRRGTQRRSGNFGRLGMAVGVNCVPHMRTSPTSNARARCRHYVILPQKHALVCF